MMKDWSWASPRKLQLRVLLAIPFQTLTWKNKPSWYQISTEDRMIHPENQAMMSSRLNAQKVISLDASHASLASQPKEAVADLIDEAATLRVKLSILKESTDSLF